ncbi:MAG: DNA repair protein RecO [Pseudomonadota bacterium]
MRITLQPAFVLHHRAYRETSVILDLLTEDHGRISAVVRGVRQPKSNLKSLLQPFIPLLISWQGRSELMTLLAVEANGYTQGLAGASLLSGLYVNELLMRVLPKYDAHPGLYTIYQQTLLELGNPDLLQKSLRLFEKNLLEALGYGLQLKYDIHRQPIVAEHFYRYHAELGFEAYPATANSALFSGTSLLALAAGQLHEASILLEIKHLMRLALAPLLGQYPIRSRQLYASRKEVEKK